MIFKVMAIPVTFSQCILYSLFYTPITILALVSGLLLCRMSICINLGMYVWKPRILIGSLFISACHGG